MIPAVVVTFHPDAAWPARLDAVLREHPRVTVVDNSTHSSAQAFVAKTAASRRSCQLRQLRNNPGIGTALNHAFSAVAAEGHTAVVAYDQDSYPAPGFAVALSVTATDIPGAAVIGANWTDPRHPGRPARFLRPSLPFGLCFSRTPAICDLSGLLCVITSGSRFDLRIWTTLGGFDERLFLDLVDTDYCLRARAAGHVIAASAAARLEHRRGEKETVRLLGHNFHPAFTPPFRLRCLSRNRILIFRRRRLRPLAWTLYDTLYGVKLVADALLLEDQKLARIGAMLRGTWDGLRNRAGPVRPY